MKETLISTLSNSLQLYIKYVLFGELVVKNAMLPDLKTFHT